MMNAKDRLILALDTGLNEANKTIGILRNNVGMYKVNSLFFADAVDFSPYHKRTTQLAMTTAGMFLDLKFYDIPNTVANYAKEVVKNPLIKMFTVHAAGGQKMMSECMKVVKDAGENRPKVVAVTVLTSFDNYTWTKMYETPDGRSNLISDQVKRFAELALISDIDGVVCSPQEIKLIRETCGKDFLIVTPGIRPMGADVGDQKRVTTPRQAIEMGADYIVVGRPILEAPNMQEAVDKIIAEMSECNNCSDNGNCGNQLPDGPAVDCVK